MTTDLTREQIEALKAKAADWFIITENYNGRRVSTSDQIVSSLVAVINQLEREQSAALQAPQFQPAMQGREWWLEKRDGSSTAYLYESAEAASENCIHVREVTAQPSDVVEKVAMAICDAQGDPCWHEPNATAGRAFSMNVARAAVDAWLTANHKGE